MAEEEEEEEEQDRQGLVEEVELEEEEQGLGLVVRDAATADSKQIATATTEPWFLRARPPNRQHSTIRPDWPGLLRHVWHQRDESRT